MLAAPGDGDKPATAEEQEVCVADRISRRGERDKALMINR
jgi:hypothetical protein